jgi:hypothetical protein
MLAFQAVFFRPRRMQAFIVPDTGCRILMFGSSFRGVSDNYVGCYQTRSGNVFALENNFFWISSDKVGLCNRFNFFSLNDVKLTGEISIQTAKNIY